MAKLLLVEDHDMNREMLARRLRLRGFTIALAINGQVALAQATASSPDLILMDIGLPDIDGLEVTKRLRSQAETQNIPIIALTAYALAQDRQRAFDAGCNDFVHKPFVFQDLLNAVERLLPTQA